MSQIKALFIIQHIGGFMLFTLVCVFRRDGHAKRREPRKRVPALRCVSMPPVRGLAALRSGYFVTEISIMRSLIVLISS